MALRFLSHSYRIVKEAPTLSEGFKELWRQIYYMNDIKWGTLVGIDQFGNKYYENSEEFILGRDRWVFYKDYEGGIPDPTTVPPTWFLWLHHMTDKNPTTVRFTPHFPSTTSLFQITFCLICQINR